MTGIRLTHFIRITLRADSFVGTGITFITAEVCAIRSILLLRIIINTVAADWPFAIFGTAIFGTCWRTIHSAFVTLLTRIGSSIAAPEWLHFAVAGAPIATYRVAIITLLGSSCGCWGHGGCARRRAEEKVVERSASCSRRCGRSRADTCSYRSLDDAVATRRRLYFYTARAGASIAAHGISIVACFRRIDAAVATHQSAEAIRTCRIFHACEVLIRVAQDSDGCLEIWTGPRIFAFRHFIVTSLVCPRERNRLSGENVTRDLSQGSLCTVQKKIARSEGQDTQCKKNRENFACGKKPEHSLGANVPILLCKSPLCFIAKKKLLVSVNPASSFAKAMEDRSRHECRIGNGSTASNRGDDNASCLPANEVAPLGQAGAEIIPASTNPRLGWTMEIR